jgi:hypothetical protein
LKEIFDLTVPLRFAVFSFVYKTLRLPRKSAAEAYETLHLSRKMMSTKDDFCKSKIARLPQI